MYFNVIFRITSLLFINAITLISEAHLGQAVNNASTYGLGLMVGFFLSGYLYENMDTSFMFIISSLIVMAGGVIFQAIRGAERSARDMRLRIWGDMLESTCGF